MYSRGSNALKTEYYTYDNRSKSNAESAKRRAAAKRAKNNKLKKQKIVAFVFLAAFMAFIVLMRSATIAKEFNALTKAKNELTAVNALVVEAQMSSEGNADPKRIEKEAEKLGLRQPSKNQIKYISLGNKDNGEVLKNEKKSSLSAFINGISVILDYLY